MNNNNVNSGKFFAYHYKFIFTNGVEKEFRVKLDNKTLNLVPSGQKSYPQWTQLKCFKCPNCSLEEDQNKFCPVAVNLVTLVDFFKSLISYEEVEVLIDTPERKYLKHTSLQSGLSSLVGIYMVTSGCPVMNKLKPMVRHHLPFATIEETQYRVISMYLLAQYFLYKRGEKPDWNLKNLIKIYEDIRIVNKSFHQRLCSIKTEDASLNALVKLDCFADSVTFSLDKDKLDEIELLFAAYFK